MAEIWGERKDSRGSPPREMKIKCLGWGESWRKREENLRRWVEEQMQKYPKYSPLELARIWANAGKPEYAATVLHQFATNISKEEEMQILAIAYEERAKKMRALGEKSTGGERDYFQEEAKAASQMASVLREFRKREEERDPKVSPLEFARYWASRGQPEYADSFLQFVTDISEEEKRRILGSAHEERLAFARGKREFSKREEG